MTHSFIMRSGIFLLKLDAEFTIRIQIEIEMQINMEIQIRIYY